MSNVNIVRGIFDACDRFDRKEIVVLDLQLAVKSHASAIEGLDGQQLAKRWEFCTQLEEVEFETPGEQQESRAMQVVRAIRDFFSKLSIVKGGQ